MTASSPAVSIIIPAYNAARFIRTSLSSVLAQTFTDYEVIVVDDGSTDDTKAVVASVEGPIRYHYTTNGGPSAARNLGINLARGQFVCFLDADDSWLPEKLTLQVDLMRRNPEWGLTFTDEEEYDETGVVCPSLVATSRYSSQLAAERPIEDAYRKLLDENFIPTSTVMIRRDCFNRSGLFDVSMKASEDRDVWSRIAFHFPVAYLPRVLGRKRVVASSLSRDVETTLRCRIHLWNKAHASHPDLATQSIVDGLLAPTYLQLGFVLLNKGNMREARVFGWKALNVSRSPYEWLLAGSLVLFSYTGKSFADFVFGAKRRLVHES